MWRNIGLVIKHDVGVVLRQWTFWLFCFITPVLMLGYFTYDVVRDNGQSQSAEAPSAEATPSTPEAMLPVGLVDEAGLIVQMPPGLPANLFVRYPDQAAATAALEADQIRQYVYLPVDYISTGVVTVFARDFQLRGDGKDMGVAYGSSNEWMLEYLLNYNLIGNDQLLAALLNPTPGNLVIRHALNPPAADSPAQPAVGFIASAIPFIFYFILVLSGGYLLRLVTAEKENRTAEGLLLSLPPRQMMVGKLLAASVLLMIQLAIWLSAALLMLNRNAEMLRAVSFALPLEFWLWATLFLILGYLLFASVMAATGAIAPSAREGNAQVIWVLIIPLMPTMMFASDFAEQPASALVVFLSLFPFSAPSAMVTRLAVGAVPLWQVGVSLAGLALTAWLFISWASRFFRADTLLSFAPFNWRQLLTAWRR